MLYWVGQNKSPFSASHFLKNFLDVLSQGWFYGVQHIVILLPFGGKLLFDHGCLVIKRMSENPYNILTTSNVIYQYLGSNWSYVYGGTLGNNLCGDVLL